MADTLDDGETLPAEILQALAPADFALPTVISKDAFWAELDQMTGWSDIKDLLKEKARAIDGAVRRGKSPTDAVEPYWILEGPPGTGKTTLAKLLAKFGAAYGLIAMPETIETQGASFQGQFVGQTSGAVAKQFEKAWGRLLFVDEVSGLAKSGGDFKSEAAKTILAQTENHRGKFMMVVADYSENINQFLALDPGIARRFGNRITLAPWTAAEAAADLVKRLGAESVPTAGIEPALTTQLALLAKEPGYASGGDSRELAIRIVGLVDGSGGDANDVKKALPGFIEQAVREQIDKKRKAAGPVSAVGGNSAAPTAHQTATPPLASLKPTSSKSPTSLSPTPTPPPPSSIRSPPTPASPSTPASPAATKKCCRRWTPPTRPLRRR